MKKTVVFTLFLFFGLFVSTSSAAWLTLFGPKQYVRTTGAPNVYTDTFSATPKAGKIIVRNGSADRKNRKKDAVSSAVIFVNGVQLFGPNDFNQQVYILEASVNLNEENSIVIELASKPNSFLTIEIIQEAELPTVAITADPETIHTGETSTLTWHSTNSDTCIIEPGIGSVDANGTLVVSPAGITNYTITAAGPGGTAAVNVTITVENTAPVAVDDGFTADEGMAVTTDNVLANDTDADGDSLHVADFMQPAHGTVVSHGDGTFTYTPAPQFYGTDNFTYTVGDGNEGTDTATVTVQVVGAPLSVGITSPADGAGIITDTITVTGTVNHGVADVFVNGITAKVDGNEFTAEHVPLVSGTNTISVLAQEGDVTAVASISVLLQTQIDLEPVQVEITSLSRDDSSLKVAGEVTVTVANTGNGNIDRPYKIILFEDTDVSGSYEKSADNLLGEMPVSSGPGAGQSVDIPIQFVGELLFRDNRMHVFVDSANDIEETDENNNVGSSQFSGMDLSASHLNPDDTACPESVVLSVRIGNAGANTIPPGVSVAFYDGDPQNGGVLIGTVPSTQALAPGRYEDLTLQWSIPSAGVKTIYAQTDDDGTGTGSVDETDEENNRVVSEMALCAAPPPPVADGISGQAIDAVTGEFLAGVEVVLHTDDEGYPGAEKGRCTTGAHGGFVFSGLDPAAYILVASFQGYVTAERRVVIAAGETLTDQNMVLSPVPGPDEIRIVLTWGDTPLDLEAHLTAPNPDGCRHHCFYWNKQIPGACLDRDDRDSYGPETITINQKTAGTYRFYVHDFTNRLSANNRSLSGSGAEVKVYFGSGKAPMSFAVPSGEGTVWHVFNLDGATEEITPVGKLTHQEHPGKIDFPVITSFPGTSATYGVPYTYQIEAADPDPDALNYSLVKGPEGMSVDPFTGLIRWTPAAGHGGWHEVEIRVRDGRCGEDAQMFRVYVSYRPVVQFQVAPCSGFNPGGQITLSWETDRAETVSIDQGIGWVPASGSLTIDSPPEPGAYTLTAVNGAGEVRQTVPRRPEAHLTARCVQPDGTSTLAWTSECALSCQINQGIGEVPLNGSREVVLSRLSATLILTCTNGAGSTQKEVRTTYCEPQVRITATPNCEWSPGDPVTLTWSSREVTVCEINPDIGEVSLSGSMVVNPVVPTTYVLIGTNENGGMASDRITIPREAAVQFFATPVYLDPGESTTLTWSTSCADTITLNQGIGPVETHGSLMVTPDELPATYTLTATGERGPVTRSVTIRSTPPAATFSVSPGIIKTGQTATLSWSGVHATACTIEPDIGAVPLSGSITVSPDRNTTYTLTASGPGGTVTKRATVTFERPAVQIQADPEVVAVGESATLTWIFSNADICAIDQGIGEVQLGGRITVSPERTTTYTITATGPGGTATDSVTVRVTHPPSIKIVKPDGFNDTADRRFTIRWTDDDHDDNASISLYYDIDNSGGDGTLIVSGLREDLDGLADEYEWDTTGMAEGTYYIYAVIDDARHEPVVDYSDGQVTISHYKSVVNAIKLTASDAAAGDFFGGSVSISGDYAIVGAPYDDDGRWDSGSAYIFRNDGGVWNEQAKLTASDAARYDSFGWSVSISGDYAIVGAPDDDGGGYNSGSAYIFRNEGGIWIEQAKLTAGDAARSDRFGGSVSISGDYAIVGAGGLGGKTGVGSAYIFKREGTDWIAQAKLRVRDTANAYHFGCSVSINGDYAIVGADRDDDGGSDSGSAYIFKREGGIWIEQAKLTASDAAQYDFFGGSVSISGDYALVGAMEDDDGGSSSGSAYIFKRDGLIWTEQAKLTASDATAGDWFGRSVSISGGNAIVGAVYDDDGGSYYGSAYIFKRDGLIWTEQAKLTASDAAAHDEFGWSVSISGGNTIVGAWCDDDGGSYSGSAYIFPIIHVKISAESDIIDIGNSATLTWSSALADSCVVEPDIGSVDANGSIVVSPGVTTTYTITADGPYGTITDSVVVKVIDPSIPPAVTIGAEPATIDMGAFATLSWNSANAASCVIEPGNGVVNLNGSVTVSPVEDTTYTITAANSGGTTTANVTVNVTTPPPTVSIIADHASVPAGDSATLSWTSAYANSVTIDNGIGEVSANGFMVVFPTATTTYTITATGSGGTTTSRVTVAVTEPAPTVSISAAPMEITVGESATLTWSTSNANSVVIDQGIGTVASNDPIIVTPTATTTYTITATGSGGTTTSRVTVTVTEPAPMVSISAVPAEIPVGESATLTWNTSNAETVVIDQGIGTVEADGSTTITLTTTTTYTITATGPGGTITAAATLTVVSPISLQIISPMDGDLIARTEVMVEGTFANTTGNETGITVNGLVALVYGNRFVANHMPLQEGENTITVNATDTDGNTAETSMLVTAEPAENYIVLSADRMTGLSPLETTLSVEGSFDITASSLSYSGPGTVEFVESGADSYRIRLTTEGVYYFTVEATDNEGSVHSDSMAVVVQNRAELDALLKARWNAMKTALIAGNIEKALIYHNEGLRSKYEAIYTLLGSDLAPKVEQMQDIELIYATGDRAKYRIGRDHDIDGTPIRLTYYIYFGKDKNGIWKIEKY